MGNWVRSNPCNRQRAQANCQKATPQPRRMLKTPTRRKSFRPRNKWRRLKTRSRNPTGAISLADRTFLLLARRICASQKAQFLAAKSATDFLPLLDIAFLTEEVHSGG